MPLFAPSIVAASARSLTLAEKLLVGIAPRNFARKPAFGPIVVDTNHPAFVYGHLALYPGRVMRNLGLELGPAATPGQFEDLFKAGTECHDDPEGKIYPAMNEISEVFFRAYRHAHTVIAELPDAVFEKQTPEERYRAYFPTLGGLSAFMLNNHLTMHLGQVSTWRRCFGLASAM